MPSGWGTAVGNLTNWLNPVFNKRDRLKRQLAAKAKEIEALELQPATPENAARHTELERQHHELRLSLEALRD